MAVLYRTNAQSRVIEEAFMRLGVPYKVVGGTRFYDRREVKDAMAYLRAVVNPVDEVSVKRVLNVPKRGVGDASIAKLDALAPAEGIPFIDALRRADEAGVTGPGVRGIASFVELIDRARRAAQPTTSKGPADVLQAALDDSGYLAELEAEDTIEAHGRIENLGELVGSAREFTVIDEFLEQVALVADTDDLPDGEIEDQVILMTLHSAKGLEFPVVFLIGVEEGDLPAHPGAHRAGRDGGGAPPRLRRHHPGDAASVHVARLEPAAVRIDAVQPAVALLRRDPRAPDRVDRQRERPVELRPPELSAARGSGGGGSYADPPPYRRGGAGGSGGGRDINADIRADQDAHRERVVEAAIRSGRAELARSRRTARSSGCESATTSNIPASARA